MTPQAQVATSADFASRNARLTELADELETSTRLLEAVTNAPAMTSPLIEEHEAQPIGARPDRQFSLSTIPALRAALGTDITPPEGSLLQRIGVTQATPVPVAAQSLQLHVAKVTEEALALADDPEFQAHVRAMDVLRLQAPGTTTPEKWLPDVDVSGRITPLGIGDLKVVKQTLLAYVPGEVAHIENILKGEHNERKHRKLDWTETTVATSEEEVKDTERDTQSTERFELKRESSRPSRRT